MPQKKEKPHGCVRFFLRSAYERFCTRHSNGNRGRRRFCPAESGTFRPRPGALCKRMRPRIRRNRKIRSFRNLLRAASERGALGILLSCFFYFTTNARVLQS